MTPARTAADSGAEPAASELLDELSIVTQSVRR
jgi:hypothetical protein